MRAVVVVGGAGVTRSGVTPQLRQSRRTTRGSEVTARIGQRGRYFETAREVKPVSVTVTIAAARSSCARCTAARATASVTDAGRAELRGAGGRRTRASALSALRASRTIVRTASSGWRPRAVSPESITAEVPSKIAFATSVASARVGRWLRSIESSICVAVIDGLARATRWCG